MRFDRAAWDARTQELEHERERAANARHARVKANVERVRREPEFLWTLIERSVAMRTR